MPKREAVEKIIKKHKPFLGRDPQSADRAASAAVSRAAYEASRLPNGIKPRDVAAYLGGKVDDRENARAGAGRLISEPVTPEHRALYGYHPDLPDALIRMVETSISSPDFVSPATVMRLAGRAMHAVWLQPTIDEGSLREQISQPSLLPNKSFSRASWMALDAVVSNAHEITELYVKQAPALERTA